MSSVGTMSSGGMAAFVFELEDSADIFLGTDPISSSASTPVSEPSTPMAVRSGRLAHWLHRMRMHVIPRLINQANETNIELIRSTKVADGRNSLSYTTNETSQAIKAIVLGPSAENLERGFLSPSDHQVIFAANDVTVGLSAEHKVKFEDQYFDIKMIKPIPRYPSAVAYMLGIARLS